MSTRSSSADIATIDRIMRTDAARQAAEVDELRLAEVLEHRYGLLRGRGLHPAQCSKMLEQYALDWHDARLEREALIGRWAA